MEVMIACWTYWMSLADVDGFRVDTLKHVRVEDARIFCGALKEYAETIGKCNFLVAAEVAGGNTVEETYLSALKANLPAVLDIGESRDQMRSAALGGDAEQFLNRYNPPHDPLPGSHRAAGSYFVVPIDDQDDTGTSLQRFPSLRPLAGPHQPNDVDSFFHPRQTVIGSAFLLLTLGIPCMYYGAEQGLAAPAIDPLSRLPRWQSGRFGGDRYLREAMFGPEHPRPLGAAGRPSRPGGSTSDPTQPGFGPFGSTGHHMFDQTSPDFRRIKALLSARARHAPLRLGRQYWRPVTLVGDDPVTGRPVPGVVAWSRILAWQEAVVVVNTNPDSVAPDAQILVDADLNPDLSRFRVVTSTAQCDGRANYLDAGTSMTVVQVVNHPASFIVRGLPAYEVVVLVRDAMSH